MSLAIEVLVSHRGADIVHSRLIERFRSTEIDDRVGAVLCGHWVHHLASDVRRARRREYLVAFIHTDNLTLRRALLANLALCEACPPAELEPLVAEARRVAERHEDSYIRDRIAAERDGGPFPALPPYPSRSSIS